MVTFLIEGYEFPLYFTELRSSLPKTNEVLKVLCSKHIFQKEIFDF